MDTGLHACPSERFPWSRALRCCCWRDFDAQYTRLACRSSFQAVLVLVVKCVLEGHRWLPPPSVCLALSGRARLLCWHPILSLHSYAVTHCFARVQDMAPRRIADPPELVRAMEHHVPLPVARGGKGVFGREVVGWGSKRYRHGSWHQVLFYTARVAQVTHMKLVVASLRPSHEEESFVESEATLDK